MHSYVFSHHKQQRADVKKEHSLAHKLRKVPVSMKPSFPNYEMCCDWSADPVCTLGNATPLHNI